MIALRQALQVTVEIEANFADHPDPEYRAMELLVEHQKAAENCYEDNRESEQIEKAQSIALETGEQRFEKARQGTGEENVVQNELDGPRLQ